jgi:hypothetical protein
MAKTKEKGKEKKTRPQLDKKGLQLRLFCLWRAVPLDLLLLSYMERYTLHSAFDWLKRLRACACLRMAVLLARMILVAADDVDVDCMASSALVSKNHVFAPPPLSTAVIGIKRLFL